MSRTEIIFRIPNLFNHKGAVLTTGTGQRFVYDQGGRAWEVRAEVTDGRKWYWGELLFETNDAVQMCAWLISRQVSY